MSSERRLSQALVIGLGPGEEGHRTLLQAIVDTARTVFDAAAASILLLDEERNDLLFAAVAGEGAGKLLGRRIPAARGIAGAVLSTRQPIVLDRARDDPRFAPEIAESTGYLPEAIMAAPLATEDRAIGVFEVLDRRDRTRSPLAELELLGLFAEQAAAGLDLFLRARRARAVAMGDSVQLASLARLAAALDAVEGERRRAAERLLDALADLLGSQ